VENVLTQTGFDKLLDLLDDADREQAGEKYESLRRRLVKFFEWRGCETADDLTDTVFDRIVKKIREGEQIQNVDVYAAAVAQFVFKEDCRRRERLFQPIEDNPKIENMLVAESYTETDETNNARFDCLEKCLAEFSEENRHLVVTYYDTDERTMIAARKHLADSLEISLNTLRIRVCRLKAKLEVCTKDCCRKIQS
jgi:DNA-directed RNA polymerase specialized sigma24 family protein